MAQKYFVDIIRQIVNLTNHLTVPLKYLFELAALIVS